MRGLIAAMGILSLLGFGVRAQSPDKPVDKPAGATVSVLKVSGMACGACAARVEKEAKKIAGVTSAKVSQPKGQAEITFDPAKTSAETIAKIIQDKTGFKTAAPKKTAPPK
ncbi:MAG: heavy-metal-associated domain-containing protein [Solirubrobacterales bacterium]|nr:heavy-metal-associated domain-containing protein [Solirubrobacterales bacterium]